MPILFFLFSLSAFAHTIGVGETLLLDKDREFDELIVRGKLRCGEGNVTLKVRSLQVFGEFSCVTKKNKITLDLEDSLMVHSGGVLHLHGDSGKSGWSQLNKSIEKGAREIQLDPKDQKLFSHWEKGDEIVIGPTGLDPLEAEKHVIQSIDIQRGLVTLTQEIKHPHWGEILRYGKNILDERAEVANLTRSIVIKNDHVKDELGGHTMVMKGSKAYVDGVELKGLGQAGRLASYPFHWHLAGDVKGQYFKNSSIHQSYQRCVVIHESMNAVVDNNTCFDFKGHGFFLETGNETGNTFSRNLAILAKYPSPGKALLASDRNLHDEGIRDHRFAGVSAFWISNPDNRVMNNVASGSVGTGFWMAFADEIRTYNADRKEFSGEILARPSSVSTREYRGNTAHTALVGHTWDGVPDHKVAIANPLNPQDRKIRLNLYRPEKIPVFQNITAWKNRNTGIYYRGDTAIFEKAVLADNGWSWFVANNQILSDSIIVGVSANRTNDPVTTERIAGVVLYDGPTEIQNVSFYDFTGTSVPFLTIGGNRKYTEIVKGLRFSPEPEYRLLNEPKFIRDQWWMDAIHSEHLIDVDGSLSGKKHAQILPETVAPECPAHPKLKGMSVCPAEKKSILVVFLGPDNVRIPFVLKKNGKPLTMDAQKLKEAFDHRNKFFQNKARLLNGNEEKYEFFFTEPLKVFELMVNSFYADAETPEMNFTGLGKNCVMKEARRAKDEKEFRKLPPPVYLPQSDGLLIRVKATNPMPFVKPAYGKGISREHRSPFFDINC